MPVEEIYTQINGEVFFYFIWMVLLTIIVAVVKWLWLPLIKGKEGERRVGKVLNSVFDNVLHDIILPDGRGGTTQLDHVALTPAGILVIETKNYSGLIFGMPKEKEWTQKLGRHTYRFQNSLLQNRLHVEAVKTLGLSVPIVSRVVFTDESSFPKEVPAGVSQLSTLKKDLVEFLSGSAPQPDLQDAWEKLKQTARTDRAAHKAHRKYLEQKHGEDRRHMPCCLSL